MQQKKEASSTNGSGITGCQYIEDTNKSISITLHKTQVQVDQRTQHKSSYTEAIRRESGK